MKNTVLTLFGGWDAALESCVGRISLDRAMKTN